LNTNFGTAFPKLCRIWTKKMRFKFFVQGSNLNIGGSGGEIWIADAGGFFCTYSFSLIL
jgi:hypothetical protein